MLTLLGGETDTHTVHIRGAFRGKYATVANFVLLLRNSNSLASVPELYRLLIRPGGERIRLIHVYDDDDDVMRLGGSRVARRCA